MNNKKVLLILILVFVIVLGGAYTMYIKLGDSLGAEQLAVQEAQTPNEDKSEDADDAGAENIAPDFIVYDIDGNEVRLHDYLGKPIVLNFWASWCGPCQMEMPDFDEKYMEIGE
jgi:thiol-disulfide isomerase/thioredoxin